MGQSRSYNPTKRFGCGALFFLGSISISACLSHALLWKSHHHHHQFINSQRSPQIPPSKSFFHCSTTLSAKPKRGSVVDSYQTVAVNCNSCKNRLFRYKKKNGTKSNLIKCFVERIVYEDPDGTLEQELDNFLELSKIDHKWACPNCGANFGRTAMIRGLPAIKLVGGKTRMTKK